MNTTKLTIVMSFLFLLLVGCNKEVSKEEFCSYVNVGKIDETIPFINEFLSDLSSNLDDKQKLQALEVWLKSYPCIIDATILCVSCIYTLPAQSEMLISFEENGVVKEFTLDISMSNPLKAVRYHE